MPVIKQVYSSVSSIITSANIAPGDYLTGVYIPNAVNGYSRIELMVDASAPTGYTGVVDIYLIKGIDIGNNYKEDLTRSDEIYFEKIGDSLPAVLTSSPKIFQVHDVPEGWTIRLVNNTNVTLDVLSAFYAGVNFSND